MVLTIIIKIYCTLFASLNTDDAEPSNIFNRIDPSKLNSALGNAVVLGKLQVVLCYYTIFN